MSVKKSGSSDKDRERAVFSEKITVFRTQFADRLRVLLDEFPTRDAASEIAGVNADQLFKYLAGASKAPFEVIARLAAAKGFSMDWLATSAGPRRITDGAGSGFALIPLWQVEASSGHGVFVGHEEVGDTFPVPLPLLRGHNPANLCAVYNRGSSNAPDINDGDIMIVERLVDRLVDGAFYLFDEDGALLVKMIERLVGGGGVILRSRNPGYEPRSLTKAQAGALHIFGRVRWRTGPI